VDSDGIVGHWTSIALDSTGHPHISYHDYTNQDLKYTYEDGSGWHIETVDSDGNVGRYTSLALDGSGHPHISYHDDTNQDLKYAYENGGGWHIETVDSDGRAGVFTSIALDGSGHPHISYYDATNHDLKYAYEDGSGWHIETVDSDGNVGQYTSLALDGSGHPHISYYRSDNGCLKYARALCPTPIDLTVLLVGDQLELSWTALEEAAAYWVYGASNLPWFVPGMTPGYEYRLAIVAPPTTTWSSSDGVGDPDNNWTYLVIAVDESEQELAQSNRVGEHDFEADIP